MSSTIVRIVAESAGGATDDVAWKLILDAVLADSAIKKQMCFGFVSNDEDGPTKRWPFILRPEGGKWVMDYGADCKDPSQATNIFDREIRLGSYFTIWDGTDEITMRIAQVNEL